MVSCGFWYFTDAACARTSPREGLEAGLFEPFIVLSQEDPKRVLSLYETGFCTSHVVGVGPKECPFAVSGQESVYLGGFPSKCYVQVVGLRVEAVAVVQL